MYTSVSPTDVIFDFEKLIKLYIPQNLKWGQNSFHLLKFNMCFSNMISDSVILVKDTVIANI